MDAGWKTLEAVVWAGLQITVKIIQFITGLLVERVKEGKAKSAYVPDLLISGKKWDANDIRIILIALPRALEWSVGRANQLMSQLAGHFPNLIFQIVADKDGIKWRILDCSTSASEETLMGAIKAIYPEAEVKATEYFPDMFQTRIYRSLAKYQALYVFPAPLPSAAELKEIDPLISLMQAANSLADGEQVVYSLAVLNRADEAYKKGEDYLTRSNFNVAFPDTYWASGRREVFEPQLMKVMQEKLQSPLYHAFLLVQIDAPSRERVAILKPATTNVVEFSKKGFNRLGIFDETETHVIDASEDLRTETLGILKGWLSSNRSETTQHLLMVLSPPELAALWHLPHKEFTASNIIWTRGAQAEIPSVMKGKSEGVCLGINKYAGREELIYMPHEDRRGHTAIIGKTDTGKSNLLHQLIHQDIQAGRGVMVIDPHGKLVRDILKWSIPKEREADVVVVDIANEEYPPPLNLLSVPKGFGKSNATREVMAVLEKFGKFDDTITVRPTLSAALTALWQEETPTIRDVTRLFNDEVYRNRLTDQLESHPAAEEFWDSFDVKAKSLSQSITAVKDRIVDFYDNGVLYPMLCHPDRLPLSSFITQNKIILVSLQADESKLPPHEQRLLGAILVSQIQMAAMAGAIPEANRPFYLYIDEVQHFVTTSLSIMFPEARKSGLALVVANQYLKQLEGNTLEALIGTVGAMICFQCGLDDAKALGPYMKAGFTVEDLINLDKYHAAVYMRFHGQQQPAFSLATQQPLGGMTNAETAEAKEREARIRQLSREQYTPKSLNDVMKWLRARYPKKRGGKPVDDGDL